MKWELKNQADGASADIYVNDFIGDWIDDFFGFGITAKQFIDELQSLPDSVRTLRLHINSPGGDAMAAHHIANTLRDQQAHKGRRVEVLIEGAAWSAATIITSAGKPTKIADNAIVMIHNPWSSLAGDASEMRRRADMLDKVRDTIVAAYRWKSSLNEEDLIALMDAETWMGADEAVKNGFADEKIEAVQAAASIDSEKHARMPKVPEKLHERVQALVRATPAPEPTPKNEPKPEPAKPTAEDVRAAALEITELCKKAGVAGMAGDFIAGGKTPDQVRAWLKDSDAIRAACVAAKLPDRANRYIKAGFTLIEARSDLFEILQAGDVHIDNKLPIKERDAKEVVVIDANEIYAKRRRRA